MSIFWNKNFISDFKSLNSDKRVSTLLWKEQDDDIYDQLSECIKDKSDIILSEVLPNELPAGTTILEYKYFIDKFIYCPPHAPPLTENTSLEKEQTNLVVIDDNYKGIFTNKIVKEVFLKEIIKRRDSILLNYNNTLNSLSDINDSLKNASNVVLISDNPLLVSYIIQSSFVFNYEFNIHPEIKNSVRLHGVGLTIENDVNQNKIESVRSKFNSIFNNSVNICIHSAKTVNSLIKLNSVDTFNFFQDDPYVKFYYSELHKTEIDDYLWCRALSTNSIENRFERRFIHSILKSTQSPDSKLLNFTIRILVNNYSVSMSKNYGTDYLEIQNEITYFIMEYYLKNNSLLDDIFEGVKLPHDRSENAIYSVIGECFILAYFCQDSDEENKVLYLDKAHYFFSKDINNNKTRYIHFDSWTDLIDLLKRSDVSSSTIDKTNFNIQFKLTPFLYNPDELELIIKDKNNPNKYEILWFFMNTFRASGIYSLYLSNSLSLLRKNSSLCDFYTKNSKFSISSFLFILLDNSIIENYNLPNIELNHKIICLILYTKIEKSAVDSFIHGLIDVENINNEESIMLFSCLSKSYVNENDNLKFIHELRGKSIFQMLKAHNEDNYIFNFCLYRLSILIDHPDSNKLLRLTESHNPFHYYLQSQFELE